MSDGQTIEAMRTAARALRSDDDLDSLRAIQAAQDALDAAKAERMHRVDTSRAFEADGASSISTWARTHLRLDAREAKQLVRSGSTLQALDAVADDAHAGRIRAEHVAAFTYGIRHVDRRIIADAQSWLLDVARTCEPAALRRVMRGLREAIYPDSLDAEWAKGMDRQDVQLNAVPDGWHLNGFLSTITGAKLKTVLDSLSAPTSADDQRTAADRRVTAVDDLCTRLLESGLPADKGVRPHLSVIVEPEAPARLAGFARSDRSCWST